VVYDVYRSAEPEMSPSAEWLVAEGVGCTNWTDLALNEGVEWTYLVRARDEGKTIDDGNLTERNGRPSGPENVFFQEGAEDGPVGWIAEPASSADSGTDPWRISADASRSGTRAWFVADEDRVKDQALITREPILIPAQGQPTLEFFHWYRLQERWDGGRLEYSTNGGRDWYDILEGNGQTVADDPERFVQGEYAETIGAPGNPLYGVRTWTGDSHGWIRSRVNLDAFGGQRLMLRWRLGCDDAVAPGRGWWLDDIRILVEESCQSCLPPAAPNGLAAVAGAQGIELSWNEVAAATRYSLSRSTTPGGPYERLADLDAATTSMVDQSVSGGTTYFYVVSVVSSCRSANSPEVSARAVGPCTLPPLFWGLDSVFDPRDSNCALDLEWRPAQAQCPDSSVRYRVFRSTSSDLQIGPETLIADRVGGRRFRDLTVADRTEYFYRLLAVDVSNLAEGGELAEHSGWTTGPDEILFHDSMEEGDGWWETAPGSDSDDGTEPWTLVDDRAVTGRRSWFCRNEPVIKDQVVALSEAFHVVDATMVLSFRHLYDLEPFWDGGRIEYSSDGGGSWHDILRGDGSRVVDNPERFVRGGYSGTISAGTGNPLAGSRAWTGYFGGWTETVIDLSDFVGTSLRFRWRLGCDASQARTGWWLDDVELRLTHPCETAPTTPPRDGGTRRY
jgi:hypothetical protein